MPTLQAFSEHPDLLAEALAQKAKDTRSVLAQINRLLQPALPKPVVVAYVGHCTAKAGRVRRAQLQGVGALGSVGANFVCVTLPVDPQHTHVLACIATAARYGDEYRFDETSFRESVNHAAAKHPYPLEVLSYAETKIGSVLRLYGTRRSGRISLASRRGCRYPTRSQT